jgi:hypothetical protein
MSPSEKYLKLGLIALSKSTNTGSWFNGHVGAEILTNTFFLLEFKISADLKNAIINRIESVLISKSEFFKSDLITSAEASSINEIEDHLEKNLNFLSTAGHGVIYGTLALKAIKYLNGWLPNEIKTGIVQLQIDAKKNDFPNRYFGYDDYQNQKVDLSDIPKFDNSSEAARYCLLQKVFFENQEIDGVHYFFHANQLHDITHSQALLMLEKLGYQEFSKIGILQLRKQIKLGKTQPPISNPYRSTETFDPFQPSFWERKVNDEHHYKLAYSIAFLINQLEDINEEEVLTNASGHWELMN